MGVSPGPARDQIENLDQRSVVFGRTAVARRATLMRVFSKDQDVTALGRDALLAQSFARNLVEPALDPNERAEVFGDVISDEVERGDVVPGNIDDAEDFLGEPGADVVVQECAVLDAREGGF